MGLILISSTPSESRTSRATIRWRHYQQLVVLGFFAEFLFHMWAALIVLKGDAKVLKSQMRSLISTFLFTPYKAFSISFSAVSSLLFILTREVQTTEGSTSGLCSRSCCGPRNPWFSITASLIWPSCTRSMSFIVDGSAWLHTSGDAAGCSAFQLNRFCPFLPELLCPSTWAFGNVHSRSVRDVSCWDLRHQIRVWIWAAPHCLLSGVRI